MSSKIKRVAVKGGGEEQGMFLVLVKGREGKERGREAAIYAASLSFLVAAGATMFSIVVIMILPVARYGSYYE